MLQTEVCKFFSISSVNHAYSLYEYAYSVNKTNEAVQLSVQPHLGQEHNNLCILLNSVQRYGDFLALPIPIYGYLWLFAAQCEFFCSLRQLYFSL